MTTDPPETRSPIGDSLRRSSAKARAQGSTTVANALERVATKADARHDPANWAKLDRDPSDLNDPRLQRWVIAGAWLLTLAMLGTCVAGGMCLAGAFRDCDCEESDG